KVGCCGGLGEDPVRHRRAAGADDRPGRAGRPGTQGSCPARPPDAWPPAQAHGLGEGLSVIEVDGLTVRFGGVTSLDGMSVTFERGTCGLIGANGAGETTALHAVVR